MQHHWDRRATAAVAETFFLGWIDEQVLLVQGKEEHLEVLRQGWARRSLKPPSGFHIKCLDLLERNSQITWGSADTKLKTTDLIKPSI
ncbi:hypothetical protein Q9233_012884 [Columba guinea]|nr:hypothetical protein Q9233_012884 [Columba guinea]